MATQSPAAPSAAPDLATSVAGEEDPGASIDLTQGRAAGQNAAPLAGGNPPAPSRPGDEAAPGTAGTGEDVCPKCGGSGKLGASACPACLGSGKVTVGIGGG
jgi:hypothetical protein